VSLAVVYSRAQIGIAFPARCLIALICISRCRPCHVPNSCATNRNRPKPRPPSAGELTGRVRSPWRVRAAPTAHCRVRRWNSTAAYQRRVGNCWRRRSRAWGSVRVPTTDCSRSRAPSPIRRKTKRSIQRTLSRQYSYAASIEQWVPNEDFQTPETKKRPCGRFFVATSKATYLPLDTM